MATRGSVPSRLARKIGGIDPPRWGSGGKDATGALKRKLRDQRERAKQDLTSRLPPPAQSAPDPHDEESMDARPDQEEMEQAINKFLQRLEKQEKRGFKDLATLLSQLPKLAQGSACSMSVVEAMEAGFLPALDKDQVYMFTLSELLL